MTFYTTHVSNKGRTGTKCLCPSSDGLPLADAAYVDADADGEGEDRDDEGEEKKLERMTSASENQRVYGRFLSGRPCRRRRLESRSAWAWGLTGPPLKMPLAFLGKRPEAVKSTWKSRERLGRSCGWYLGDDPDVWHGSPVSISWYVRKMAGRLRGIKRAIRDLRLAHFLRLDELEMCGAFVRDKTGARALGSLAVVHEEVLIALEGVNTSIEKDNLRVETIDEDVDGVLP